MLQRIYIFTILLSTLFIHFSSKAQDLNKVWKVKPTNEIVNFSERYSIPEHYRTITFDIAGLKSVFQNAPLEGTKTEGSNRNNCFLLLPLPDGSQELFQITESPIMEKKLADTYPSIKTYIAKQTDHPEVTARLDITELGFHAMIMSPMGWSFIEPAIIGNTADYICYFKKDSRHSGDFVCGVAGQNSDELEKKIEGLQVASKSNGTQLRTYRLALACTGEYAAFFGGTKPLALSAMVTSINRVTGVYEKEVAIRLVLIANDSLIIYTNAATDPYTNNNGSTMLTENINNLTSVIGLANFDIGHVFSTGGGGVAGLGVVCSSSKARGVTGSGSPVGDGFDIDYVAHEMGHQFGGNHTFNSVTSNCGGGNRNANTAMEVGSGITIMAYAGICGTDDLAAHSIAYFHTRSFEEIVNYSTTSTGNNCPVKTNTNDSLPTVNVGADFTIPISTPFTLTGSATDANPDVLTYSWEEIDTTATGGAYNQTQVNNLDFPLFRPFSPVTTPSRTFPQMSDIVNNTTTIGERLPTVLRLLDFRLTVRDNRIGGSGVIYNDVSKKITVTNTSGPFTVTAPNTSVSWTALTTQTVTWNVAGTTAAPVSCGNVKISLSNDGGYTYPTVIIASTPNDGTESITVPNVLTTQARIKIEAVGNVFFDISNTNFTIVAGSVILTTITTQALSTNKFCVGSSVSVPFTTDFPANFGNVFTAQLSNSSGSFSSGVVAIGTLNSINAGTINAVIPLAALADTSYRIRVVSSNPAINGSNNGSNISIFGIPATPGVISGTSSVCQGQNGVPFAIASIANATSYIWNLPSGASIASGINTANITANFTASATTPLVFTVAGSNAGCNGPVSSNFSITVNKLPAAAGSISGTATVCQGQLGVTYSVPVIADASSYHWTLPSGAIFTTDSTLNSITVTFGTNAVSGNITVDGKNSCGTGTLSFYAVNVNTTPVPTVISSAGSTNVCSPSTVSLSFIPVVGLSYQWRLNGVNIIGATSSTYTAIQTGNYDVVTTGIPQSIFINTTPVSIPEYTTTSCPGAASPIIVNGYGSSISTSGIYVKINITHTYEGDLAIFLQTPTGEILGLSNRTGSSGNDFINTVFADSGITMPTNGTPYTGIYKPWPTTFTNCITSTKTSFGSLNAGVMNPNGTWTLRAYDAAAGDTGSIQNWTITFPPIISNCSSTSNVIGVNINTTVATGINITSNPSGAVCAGTSITYTATPVNPGTTPFYQWKKKGLVVGTNSINYTNPAPANGDTVICIMTSNANCVTGNPATSNQVITFVNPLVAANVSISANPSNNVCNGTAVTYTAVPTNPGTTPVYQWKKNGVVVGINSSSYTNPSPANGDSIVCIMTSNANCVSGSPAISNLLIMTVNPIVTSLVSITASPSNNICAGVSVTYSAVPVNPGSTPVYQWKKNSVIVGTNSNIYTNPSPSNGDTIVCMMTSNANCVTGNPVTSNLIIMTVNPVFSASVTISANPSINVCAGTPVAYTAFPLNPGSTPVYQWKKNGNVVGTNSSSYTNPTPLNGDSVFCIMTSNANCPGINPVTSNLLITTVGNIAPIISSFSPTTGFPGNAVTITGTGFTGTTVVSFNGIPAGFIVDNNSQISAVVPAGGTTGRITVSTGCGNTISTDTFFVLPSTVLDLELFIEGFYRGNGLMESVAGTNTDTIHVLLYDSSNLSTPLISRTIVLSTTGHALAAFPVSISGHSYYIAIRHRNSIETWSKHPVAFTAITNFSFKN